MRLNSQQIKTLMSLNDRYYEILDPVNFVKNFESMEDFKEWACEGSILDLKECIKVFQSHELYEYCAVMQDLIDNLLYE